MDLEKTGVPEISQLKMPALCICYLPWQRDAQDCIGYRRNRKWFGLRKWWEKGVRNKETGEVGLVLPYKTHSYFN